MSESKLEMQWRKLAEHKTEATVGRMEANLKGFLKAKCCLQVSADPRVFHLYVEDSDGKTLRLHKELRVRVSRGRYLVEGVVSSPEKEGA